MSEPKQRERWHPMSGSRVGHHDIGDDSLSGLVSVRLAASIGYTLVFVN
jgi:hypothetical protein